MKKVVPATNENRRNLRQRLLASLAMLMVALILTVSTTFAWLTMSVAPEVAGIITNVGANGSLEIALLTSETYADPNSVKTPGIGESLAASSTAANERWGNLINLENTSYGLDQIVLYPARLNATLQPDGKSYAIGEKMLSIPSYGYDGRIIGLTDSTVPGVYNGTDFVYDLNNLGYGVRAIGSTNSLSVQSSYLAEAKGKISGNLKSAQSSAIGSVSGMQDMLMKFANGNDAKFTNSDVATLSAMIAKLSAAEDSIESALRYGLIAVAASAMANEDQFTLANTLIMNKEKTITQILAELDIKSIPSQFGVWVTAQENMQSDLANAKRVCDSLVDDDHSMSDFREALDYLMDLDKVYLGTMTTGKPILEASKADLINLPLEVTLAPGSGVYATIADFTGNYQANVGTIAKMKTAAPSGQIPYLTMLSTVVNDLTAAGGGASNKPITLTETYGYALDLAFRCNAYGSDLLLQTAGAQRVYGDSTAAATMGGGSYMEFTSTGLNTNSLIKLIDAVRVAFIDSQGNILGVAKMNTSNREIVDNVVRAPLYLYEFTIISTDVDKGKMVMGERMKDDNYITSLDQNIAKAITALVWLDGDTVDNSMVTGDSSIAGMLNLQFASSVDLIPMDDAGLKNYTLDKSFLKQDVEQAKTKVDAGQEKYTTESWTAFVAAYEYADKINSDDSAKPMQVDRAARNLKTATEALTTVSVKALNDKIAEVRKITGKTTVAAAYAEKYKNDEGKDDYRVAFLNDGDTTVPKEALATLFRVDYNKNLHNEGNGFQTRIYSDESWTALARELYSAEGWAAVGDHLSEEFIDDTITDLDNALKALTRDVYYIPYDYEGYLYYMAISNETDTYGKWYDANFQRVVADLAILNLDAYAKKVSIADIPGTYVSKGTTDVVLPLTLKSGLYGSLKDQTIVANNWTLTGGIEFDPSFDGAMKPDEEQNKIKLDVAADTFNVNELYTTPYEMLKLKLEGVAEGDHTIRGTLLTDAGVLFDVSKVLNVYTKSSGVEISGGPTGAVTVDGEGSLSANLIGGSETIASVKWYLSDGSSEILSINEYTGVWTAKAAGAVEVRVEVETAQGYTYHSESITIKVEAPAQPENP